MASLYKRATPSQARLLRIIEGSIRDAAHAHPEIELGPKLRRSIAKRAAGTISAQWPELLAGSAKVARQNEDGAQRHRPSSGLSKSSMASQGGGLSLVGPSPFIRKLIHFLAHDLRKLKEAGEIVRAEERIRALKEIHRLRKNS